MAVAAFFVRSLNVSEVSLDELVALFADPDRAPADAGPFERIETHISLVLRGRDRVYKFKKPVCFPFTRRCTKIPRS